MSLRLAERLQARLRHCLSVQRAMRAVLDLGLGDTPPADDQKIVISPAGAHLAFANPAGLRVRNAGDEQFRVLPQTEDPRDPAF